MKDCKKLSKEEFEQEVKQLRKELKSFMWEDADKSEE